MRCERCEKNEPSQNLRCWNCKGAIHVHTKDIEKVPEGKIAWSYCPHCNYANCWLKKNGKLEFCGTQIMPLPIGG